MRVVGKEVLFIKVFDQWRDRGTAGPNLQELCCRNGFERRHAGTSCAKGRGIPAHLALDAGLNRQSSGTLAWSQEADLGCPGDDNCLLERSA